MKRKKIENLTLKKETIAHLDRFQLDHIRGGASDPFGYPVRFGPIPRQIPGIDIPTINDSCFTLCDNMCNDW